MAARLSAVHRHPSLHCYKNHGCRCAECKFIGSQYMRHLRATHKKLGRGREVAQQRERRTRVTHPLGDEELMRLRRAVGLK